MEEKALLAEARKELQAAHLIIRHALNLMTTKQKTAWALQNESGNVGGEGITRANEREELIRKISDAMPDQEGKNVAGMGIIRYKKGNRDKVKRIVQGCQRLNNDGLWFVGYVSRELAGRFPRFKLDAPNIDGQPLPMKPILELAELINDAGLDAMLENIDEAINKYGYGLASHQKVAEVIPLRAS